MILTHLGKTDYAWAETTKALLIEAVDKCSDIESAKADKRKYMDVVNENGNKRVDRTTWNGGHVKGVKHGLCFYEICCDCKNQCGHAQRETKSWFVYNKGKLVWQEHSIVAVPKFATAEPKPKPTTAEPKPKPTTAEPEPAEKKIVSGQTSCDNGHALVCLDSPPDYRYNIGYICSICDVMFTGWVDEFYHCAECDYDLCPPCQQGKPPAVKN